MAFLDNIYEITAMEQIKDTVDRVEDIDILSPSPDSIFELAEALDNIRLIVEEYEEQSQ